MADLVDMITMAACPVEVAFGLTNTSTSVHGFDADAAGDFRLITFVTVVEPVFTTKSIVLRVAMSWQVTYNNGVAVAALRIISLDMSRPKLPIVYELPALVLQNVASVALAIVDVVIEVELLRP
jgi:hypothetical protein